MADCLMITQNDGTAKPVGVIQGDASDIKYDSNTSTKQKIDNVESSIPTSASVLPYSSSKSTKQAIDETGTCTLLATLTATSTEYSLTQSASNFKQIIAEAYFIGGAGPTTYILATIVLPVAEWTAGRNVIPCFNDGTLRKAQFNIVSATSVKTAPEPNFSNVTGVKIYGVK